MTDRPPKITVAFHFLGQPKPSFFHGDRVYADDGGFVSVGSTTPGVVDTIVHINKDIIERFVQMPYDPELGVAKQSTADAEIEDAALQTADRDYFASETVDVAIALANEEARAEAREDYGEPTDG